MAHARAVIVLVLMTLGLRAQPLTQSELGWPNRAPFSVTNSPSGWLKADFGVYVDAGTTLATNGQTVQQWNDASGQDFNAVQSISIRRPTYITNILNGLPVLRFAGTIIEVTNCAAFAAPALTIAMVVSFTSNHVDQLAMHFSGAGTVGIGRLGTNSASMIWDSTVDGPLTGPVIVGNAITTNQFYIMTGVFDGSSSVLRIFNNGSFSGTVDTNFNPCPIIGDITGDFGTNSVPFVGDIAELLRYPRALTSGEITLVETYLSTKWGL